MPDMLETVYTPQSPIREPVKLLVAMWRDLVASRELAWRLFVRDFSAQYRQSVFGYLWAFAPPLVSAVPWLFLSSQNILKAGETPIPYPAFVIAGTTLWSAFADSVGIPLASLNAGRAMMAKINFPREALVMGGLGHLVMNLTIRVVVMLALFVVLKVPFFTPSLALAPLGAAVVVFAGLSLGILLAPLGMLYTDVSRGMSFLMGFWMILTPVVYMPPKSGLAGQLARLNPASPLITTVRAWFTGQVPTQLDGFLWVAGGSVLVFLVGWVLMRLTLPIIVERMGN